MTDRAPDPPTPPAGPARTLSPRARLLLGGVMIGVVAWLVLGFVSAGRADRVGDFQHFYWAANELHHGRDPYANGNYIYPPLIAFAFGPFTGLTLSTAFLVWGGLSLTLIIAALWLCHRAASRAVARPASGASPIAPVALMLPVLLLSAVQLREHLRWGQTDTLTLAAMSVAWAWLAASPGLRALAGVAIGAAINVKYQPVLLLPWLLIRRRWLTAGAIVLAAIAVGLLPALRTGLDQNLDDLARGFGGITSLVGLNATPQHAGLHPVTWHASISVTSAIARVTPGSWGAHAAPLVTAGVAALTLLGTWLVYRAHGLALLRPPSPDHPSALGRPRVLGLLLSLELAGLLIAILAFSPQTMTRHCILLMPAHALAVAALLRPPPGARRTPLALGLAAQALAFHLPPGDIEALDPVADAWHHIGGPGWSMLALWAGLLLGLAPACGRRPEQATHAPITRPAATA